MEQQEHESSKLIMNPNDFQHLVGLLHWRAEANADDPAVTYLADGEDDEQTLTYAQLDHHARAIAAWLQREGIFGERVLLLYPPGLDYITAFFGCLYAGAIAVPAYPPRRLDHANDRLQSLILDSTPRYIFADESVLSKVEKRLDALPHLQALDWIDTTQISLDHAADWQMPALDGESVAFLQYTSGSTSAPKGVIVKHGNIMDNQRTIQAGYEHDKPTFVTWLPMYHDMGLIGNIMQPLYCGGRTIAMSPTAFVQRPYRWLRAITRYRAVTSGAPNFAYDLCVDKITPEEKAALDLRSWTIAYNGAEPIRSSSILRFADAFEECGFDPDAFFPCYGLAEATLFVTGGPKGTGAKMAYFDLQQLGRDAVVPVAEDAEHAHLMVGSGVPWRQTVKIVDPETRTECDETRVGEIWISGGNVAGGYWNNPEKTKEDFDAYIAGTADGPYLRTGDLGFFTDGALFVTGRIKDLIIIRGRNFYPQDIELTVQNSHPYLRPDCAAAFSMDVDGDEQLVVLQELERQHRRDFDEDEIFSAIRQAIQKAHQIVPYQIVLLDTLAILKTSSGKIQRRANKKAYLAGELAVRATWTAPNTRAMAVEVGDDDDPLVNALYPDRASTTDALIAWLRDYAATRINSFQMDERRTIAPHIVLDMGNRGALGIEVPKAYGGLGLGATDTMRVVQQLGAIDQTLALFVGLSNILGIRPIMHYASDDVKQRVLPLLATGREVAAFALTEPGAGSNPRAITTTATPTADGWRINGHKIWSGVSQWAGFINVFAKQLDAQGHIKGITAFTVRQGTQGLQQGPEAMTLGMRAMIQNALFFQDVPVTAAQMLGEPGRGMEVAQDAMMYGRLAIAACSVGAMKRSAQLILRYADRRTISTGPLLNNPVLQAHLSELTAMTDAVDSLVAQVCWALDHEIDVPDEIYTVCKVSGPEFGWQAVDGLVQFLGGRGYIEPNQAPQMLRDIRILRVFEGPTEPLKMYLGSRVMNQPQRLSQFIEEVFGTPAIAARLAERVQTVQERVQNSDLFSDSSARTQWAYSLCGDIANYGVLLAATMNAAQQTGAARFQRAQAWVAAQFDAHARQASAGLPAEHILEPADRLREMIGAYEDAIGNVQQSLPNEDRMMDEWLRKAPRDAEFAAHTPQVTIEVRAPQSPAPVEPPTPTTQPAPAAISGGGAYSTSHVRQWILQWMTRNLDGISGTLDADKAFAEYGVDSVKAVEFAYELEQWLNEQLEIDDVITWNYPTPNALAAYIASELAQLDAAAPPEAPVIPEATTSGNADDMDDADDIMALLAKEIEESKKTAQ